MTDVSQLIVDHLDIWTVATERRGAGRGGGKRVNFYGVERLRALILDLAVRGRLVPQDAGDEPAAALIPQIERERRERVKAGEIKDSKPYPLLSAAPFELAAGWTWIALGMTGNIFSGNSINEATRARLAQTSDGRPFIATKDIGYGRDPIDYNNGLRVSDDDPSFVVAQPEAVLICAEGGSAGRKIALSDREICFGNKLVANETWSAVNPRYVLSVYLSDFFYKQFAAAMTGIIGGISRAKFLALPFPLPPLAEQQRVVAKIDELMVLCDALEAESADALVAHQRLVEALLATLVASLDAAALATEWVRLESCFDILFTTEASIDALKATVLDLALRGKLVPQEVQDESADDLLKRIQYQRSKLLGSKLKTKSSESVTSGEQLPLGWKWTPLCSVGITMTGSTPKSSDLDNFGGEISFIGPGQILPMGGIILSEKFLSEKGLAQSTEAFPGDVLMVCIGGSIGKSAVVQARIAYNQQINAVRPLFVTSAFIYMCLKSSHFQREVFTRATGSATPIINRSKWDTIPIPLAPLPEQNRIVAKVNELTALCDVLKARIADAAATTRHLADVVVERAAA